MSVLTGIPKLASLKSLAGKKPGLSNVPLTNPVANMGNLEKKKYGLGTARNLACKGWSKM
jgi:hypothetical protein